jgi:hypothetical protein
VIMGMGLADLLGFWLNCSNGRRKKFCRHQIFSRRWLFWLLILTNKQFRRYLVLAVNSCAGL